MITDVNGNPYCDSNGNAMTIPVVGYVVTNVKSPMAAPVGVDAYLTGDGDRVAVNWQSFPEATDTLLGYYIYRICDDRDPIRVNASILPATATDFVDTSILKPGKIYTYYVAACYKNEEAEYMTMNSDSSSVVWGIPQLPKEAPDTMPDADTGRVASIFNDGSFAVLIAMVAFGVAVAAIGIVVISKRKQAPVETKKE